MLPELGHFALILALLLAVVQAVFPLLGSFYQKPAWVALGQPAACAQAFFLVCSLLCLTAAFILNDFSVAYVAENSNSRLPLHFRISAVWGAHEGSMLLWMTMLSLWGMSAALASRHLPENISARLISVLGWVSVGFLLFILLTSNPFERLLPYVPLDGADLNPLLQDIGLIIHPPLLYLGYVGLVVPFAFAMAVLMSGNLASAWARWLRPWAVTAWVFLTLGILLGSWWAYRELGWGGWWFWDPVENASLLPWLVATALIHSLAVTDKRGMFKAWTIFLAIFAFSLSLLGTFLVRSGVLTSVHAFANDPARGVFILILLGISVGSAMLLYAWRAQSLREEVKLHLWSRETMLLANNVLLVVMTLSILLGTLYPLILDAFNLGLISVGPPYFNAMFVPLAAPLLFLMALGPHQRWSKTQPSEWLGRLRYTFAISVTLGVVLPFVVTGSLQGHVVLGLALACWVLIATLQDLLGKGMRRGKGFTGVWQLPRSQQGMVIAHVGVAVCAIGIALSSQYSQERDVRMVPGDAYTLGAYTFLFEEVVSGEGPNYTTTTGLFEVSKTKRGGEQVIGTLAPQKRLFYVRNQIMTRAAILANGWRDLYIALGEPLDERAHAWAVRIVYKPFVRWIWLGGLLIALGGFVALFDRRYRQKVAQAFQGAIDLGRLKPANAE